jgi:hypothetical protein
MRTTWLSTIVVALLLGAATAGPALADTSNAAKPLAVLAFSGYNGLKGNVAYVGRLAGNPNLAVGLEVLVQLALKNQPLAGLDKDRPWGAVVLLDQEKFAQGVRQPEQLLAGYALVPVTDLKKLLQVLEPAVGPSKDAGEGALELKNKEGKPFYVKQVDDWAIFSDHLERLATPPANPMKLLAGLSRQYDLAVRFNPSNVPAEIRRMVIAGIQAKAQQDLQQHAGETSDELAGRKIIGERIVRGIARAIDEIDQLTIGWSLDQKAEKTYLDLVVAALPGTQAAREFASLSQAKTDFGGFLLPEAMLAGNWTKTSSTADAAELANVSDLIRKKVLDDIEKQHQPEEKATTGRKLANQVFDVIRSTLAAGRADGGLAVISNPDALTLVAGGVIVDGDKLNQTFKDLVAAVGGENPGIYSLVKLDAGEHKGVKFHTISIPLPGGGDEQEKVAKMIGDTLEIAVGIGPKSVYFAAGRAPMDLVKTVIDKSSELAGKAVPPLRITLDAEKLTKLLAVVGKEEDRPKAALAADLLAKSPSQDHVTLVASPIENGVRLRLEVEPGVLKALGMAASGAGKGK